MWGRLCDHLGTSTSSCTLAVVCQMGSVSAQQHISSVLNYWNGRISWSCRIYSTHGDVEQTVGSPTNLLIRKKHALWPPFKHPFLQIRDIPVSFPCLKKSIECLYPFWWLRSMILRLEPVETDQLHGTKHCTVSTYCFCMVSTLVWRFYPCSKATSFRCESDNRERWTRSHSYPIHIPDLQTSPPTTISN